MTYHSLEQNFFETCLRRTSAEIVILRHYYLFVLVFGQGSDITQHSLMATAAVSLMQHHSSLQGQRIPLADGVEDVHLRRASPRFPPEMWNVHAATLENDQRTNNVCEGWNNGFAHLVDQKHPSIWKLIEHLQAEEKRVHVLMLKQERGIVTKKRMRQETHELQKRLHNLCTDFTEGRRDVASFLRGVSHNIRFGQPNV
jgi:hypothetical protein